MYLYKKLKDLLERCPLIYRFIKKSLLLAHIYIRRAFSKNINSSKLLWGGENGIPVAKYARLTNNFLRPSTLLADIPHVKFLKLYQDIGDSIFIKEVFENTDYYKNAAEAIELRGTYFGIYDKACIVEQGRRFVSLYCENCNSFNRQNFEGISSPNMPVLVRKINFSNGFYEIVDGHHRLAISFVRGISKHRAFVLPDKPVTTPLQNLVFDCVWTNGAKELYQPLNYPEFEKKWFLVRRCEDRLAMVLNWLKKNSFNPKIENLSYMDVGSNYGWFVAEMEKRGFSAFGVERDPAAIKIGEIAYQLNRNKVKRKDIVDFCKNEVRRYDIVTCFSVLHHFVLGKASVSAEEFIKLIDKITGTVLFIDTGQSHEQWFEKSLPEWDEGFIKTWITKNTSFNCIEKIGVDGDSQFPFDKNYGRALFACTRKN